MPLSKPKNLSKTGKQRFAYYLTAAAVILGVAVATLITLGKISEDQFNEWVVMVGITVPALLGIVTSFLALFNIEKAPDQQPRHAAPEDQV